VVELLVAGDDSGSEGELEPVDEGVFAAAPVDEGGDVVVGVEGVFPW
jgi:hypothetical protein